MKIGIGQVLRGFEPTRPLLLGGVKLQEGWGLRGPGDGDVLLLAIADAVLGAAGLGDKGDHGGREDAPSAVRVSEARVKAAALGLEVGNVDATVFAERLEVRPHRACMEERIAQLLGIEAAGVNVKVEQASGLGPVGEAKAVSATAIVLLDDA